VQTPDKIRRGSHGDPRIRLSRSSHWSARRGSQDGSSLRLTPNCCRLTRPTIRAQLEGGLIFGLTAALYGEITIDKGRVQQSNFNDYRMLRINQAPRIDIHVMKSGEEPGGIGETGVTAGPPALRNAIYAATGVALRRLPIDQKLIAGKKA
jgi:CO/xanthine dehydrogenase Mo-binding subunit